MATFIYHVTAIAALATNMSIKCHMYATCANYLTCINGSCMQIYAKYELPGIYDVPINAVERCQMMNDDNDEDDDDATTV